MSEETAFQRSVERAKNDPNRTTAKEISLHNTAVGRKMAGLPHNKDHILKTKNVHGYSITIKEEEADLEEARGKIVLRGKPAPHPSGLSKAMRDHHRDLMWHALDKAGLRAHSEHHGYVHDNGDFVVLDRGRGNLPARLKKGTYPETPEAAKKSKFFEETNLEEAKELSPKQNLLLRAMATDPQDINKMRRAIKLGDKALMNPVMRQEILKMLDQMMDVSLNDPTIFAKTRQIFKKRKATDTTNTE
jgi:hypothetical protein